jgi:hypothetical protein
MSTMHGALPPKVRSLAAWAGVAIFILIVIVEFTK